MKILISCDDGCQSDIKLAELCKKYDTVCMFYWPVEWQSLAHDKGYEPLAYEEAYQLARHFEVGSHTVTHRHLTKIPEQEAKNEIADSQLMLQQLFNVPVTAFAPPRGYTNDSLTEFTLKFYDKQRLTREPGLVHIHPDSGANDNKPWGDCITIDTKELFCHSWELDKYNLWQELEDYLERS